MDWLQIVFEMGVACFEVYIMKMMSEGFLKRKKNIPLKVSVPVIICAVIISAAVSFFMNGAFINY